jgi:cysteine desulfurase
MKAETAVIAFDLDGVGGVLRRGLLLGKVTPSHVLAAMGVSPPLARARRAGQPGAATTESDVERFLDAWRKLFQTLANKRDIAA